MNLDRRALALAALPLVTLTIYTVLSPNAAADLIQCGFQQVGQAFGAAWQGFALALFGVGLAVALGPWGRARLGSNATPEFGFFRWIAVLLCTLLAGGGVFWSAAEPIYHFTTVPPHFEGTSPNTTEAAAVALAQSHLHWGFLAWSLVGGLAAIALSASHSLDSKPLRPSTLLQPLFGDRVFGTFGSVVDAVSIVAVVAGTVGPIGFLALQLSSAAETELGLVDGPSTRLLILGALVVLYTISAATGIQRGIQWLSRLNVGLAILLGFALFVIGPTSTIRDAAIDSFTVYGREFIGMATSRGDSSWLGYWTVFYWAWFIGYAPVMSIFIARVSKGRTVRELLVAVSIIAPLVTNLWFCSLGGTGLGLELESPGIVTEPLEQNGLASALVATLSALPGSTLLVPAFVVLIFCFLATTGDSISYAISVILARSENPPVSLRVGWGVGMGVLAGVLLHVGGEDGSASGIDTLQQFIVITAAPVSLIVLPSLVTGPLAARRLLREQSRPSTRPEPARSDEAES